MMKASLLFDLSIGFEKGNLQHCRKRSRQINIVSEYEWNFKAAFGDSAKFISKPIGYSKRKSDN